MSKDQAVEDVTMGLVNVHFWKVFSNSTDKPQQGRSILLFFSDRKVHACQSTIAGLFVSRSRARRQNDENAPPLQASSPTSSANFTPSWPLSAAVTRLQGQYPRPGITARDGPVQRTAQCGALLPIHKLGTSQLQLTWILLFQPVHSPPLYLA